MKIVKKSIFLGAILILNACSQKIVTKTIIIENTLNTTRKFETVALKKNFLQVKNLSVIGIRDAKTKELQVTQSVDTNGDGIIDELLFQPEINPNSEKKYEIVIVSDEEKPTAPTLCYSRFVPERTDDYAWENNKVAFRMFGPTAQKMIEEGTPGGTLTSGVDAWLKRVEYPIINKWYKKYTEGTGTYHKDTGEGLDNFHVGISRGIGGIAIKVDSTYYYSKNYTQWRTITTGPIRTSFHLEFNNWDAAGNTIKESKTISLDLGNNLSKFVTTIEGTHQIAAGLTLHDKKGVIQGNTENGWVSHWEPIGDSEIGTAIVADKKYFKGFENYKVNARDESNAYANLNVIDKKVVYYAGFGWKKNGEFKNEAEWTSYLNAFSKKIANPLIVRLNK